MTTTTPRPLKYQRGYIDIPKGVMETIGVFAAIGILTIVCCCVWLGYWLITHVRFI